MSKTTDGQNPMSNIANKIIQKVAQKEGIEPQNLSPLTNAVDPATFELLNHGTEKRRVQEWSITISYSGYSVQVNQAGEITVVSD